MALSLTSCSSSPELVVVSGDRAIYAVQAEAQVQVEADGHRSTLTSTSAAPLWVVSAVWMQERYQLERGLRLRVERCEIERTQESATK